jgi:WD40 repeat protein
VTAIALLALAFAPAADETRTFTAGKQSAHIALAPDGKLLAIGSGESLKLHDPATGKEVRSLGGNTRSINAIAFSPDGKLLASGTGGFLDGKQGGEVRVWDVAAGKVTLTPPGWENGDVQAVTFSSDGKRLTAGGSLGIRVWDVATGKPEKEIKTEAAILALTFSPDGKVLVAGAFTGQAHLWDTGTWKETVLDGHKTEVRAVCYSPDGKNLITGAGGEFRVWDRANKLLKTVKHPDLVYAVTFTQDGKAVATGSGLPREDLTGTICLWDATDWSEKQRWSGKGGLVESLAFSPNGKVLVAGRFDGTVEIRKLPEGVTARSRRRSGCTN